MSLAALLAFGFLLGMRHATDADHVVAVSTIVSRERRLGAAAPIGISWGLGHMLTLVLVGGAIVLFGIVIPPRIGLGMEFSVAILLVLLGALNLRSLLFSQQSDRAAPAHTARHAHAMHHAHPHPSLRVRWAAFTAGSSCIRPFAVGVVHGLAGSAAVALLVLGVIRDPAWALGYLSVFGVGTIAGMLVITTALALPLAVMARRFQRLQRSLCLVTGVGSLLFGAFLGYEIGFVQGLFGDHVEWTPE